MKYIKILTAVCLILLLFSCKSKMEKRLGEIEELYAAGQTETAIDQYHQLCRDFLDDKELKKLGYKDEYMQYFAILDLYDSMESQIQDLGVLGDSLTDIYALYTGDTPLDMEFTDWLNFKMVRSSVLSDDQKVGFLTHHYNRLYADDEVLKNLGLTEVQRIFNDFKASSISSQHKLQLISLFTDTVDILKFGNEATDRNYFDGPVANELLHDDELSLILDDIFVDFAKQSLWVTEDDGTTKIDLALYSQKDLENYRSGKILPVEISSYSGFAGFSHDVSISNIYYALNMDQRPLSPEEIDTIYFLDMTNVPSVEYTDRDDETIGVGYVIVMGVYVYDVHLKQMIDVYTIFGKDPAQESISVSENAYDVKVFGQIPYGDLRDQINGITSDYYMPMGLQESVELYQAYLSSRNGK